MIFRASTYSDVAGEQVSRLCTWDKQSTFAPGSALNSTIFGSCLTSRRVIGTRVVVPGVFLAKRGQSTDKCLDLIERA